MPPSTTQNFSDPLLPPPPIDPRGGRPGLTPRPTEPRFGFRTPKPEDQAYARSQVRAYAPSCPHRLDTDHALRYPGPVAANTMSLGRPPGQRGVVIALEQPLPEQPSVGSAVVQPSTVSFFFTAITESALHLASVVAAAAAEFVVVTIAPKDGLICLRLVPLLFVVIVVWWLLATAANMHLALTTWSCFGIGLIVLG